jgi:single-strand DNA-binding protein
MAEVKNKVQLIGNLGNKPDVRTTDAGKKYARFSIATSEYYKNAKGEPSENTYWHNIVAWGDTAELAERLLNKGTQVSVQGKLTSHTYTDKEGIKRFVTEVHANQISLVDDKNSRNGKS